MSENEVAHPKNSSVTAAGKSQRESAQVTLSTIGDLSLAASEAVGRVRDAPRQTLWKPVLLFFFVVCAASVGFAWLMAGGSPWARIVLAPLLPVICASVAFWWRQRWKFHAQDWQVKLRVWQDALDGVGHEAANAVNAARANLVGFRVANPQVSMPEHLDEVEVALRRVDAVVQKARDPVAWKGARKKKTQQPAASDLGEDARSRVSL